MHPDTNLPGQQGKGPDTTAQAAGAGGEQGQGAGADQPTALDARERQIHEDYEWCLRSPDVQHAYRGKVVVVHRRQILGAGDDHAAALAAALSAPSCPSRDQLAFVVVPEGPPAERV